jgi:hypothetical protein
MIVFLVQSSIYYVHKLCLGHFLKYNFSNIKVIFCTRNTNVLNHRHRFRYSLYWEQIVLGIWVCVLISNFVFSVTSFFFFHLRHSAHVPKLEMLLLLLLGTILRLLTSINFSALCHSTSFQDMDANYDNIYWEDYVYRHCITVVVTFMICLWP